MTNSNNYLDATGGMKDDYFYIVVSQKESGEMVVVQNISANPRQQRFLRTKQEAEEMKLSMGQLYPETKLFVVSITADPTCEMMWPEGFEERLDFAKKLNQQ